MRTQIVLMGIFAGFLLSCSSDSGEGDNDLFEAELGFNFVITGAIEKTISGDAMYFVATSNEDIFGELLNTTSFAAVDQGNGQVSFGITTYDILGKGSYPIELRIAPEAYNGFVNFVENPPETPVFGPQGGAIILESLSADEVSGRLDVTCVELASGDQITIKGSFRALRQ